MRRWITWLLLVSLLLTGCAWKTEGNEVEDGYLVYYLVRERTGGDALEQTYVSLGLEEDASQVEKVAAIVGQMLQEPEDNTLKSVFPKGTELLGVTVTDRRAVVDLSSSVSRLEGIELTLVDYGLTLALTALEGIRSVTIMAQGRPIVQQPKQVFYERDVLLSTMDDGMQTVEVTLYYLNEEGALQGERRTLEIYEGQTVAENLVLELLKGPESRELTAVLPEEFAINSVRVENGVCYVNLTAAALASIPEDTALQEMMLWSLADSVYSLETVTEI